MFVILDVCRQLRDPVEGRKLGCILLNLLLNLGQNWNLIFTDFDAIQFGLLYLRVPAVLFDAVDFVTLTRVHFQKATNHVFAVFLYVAGDQVVKVQDFLVELVSIWVLERQVANRHRVSDNP